MKETQIALQLYTLRNETERDFVGTLEKVAKLGYKGVEFAGYGGLTAADLKQTLDYLGLKATSSHVALTLLESDLGQVIDYQQAIGNRHIVCPFLPPERRTKESYFELVPILNEIGRKCAEAGITFSYHNHDFELEAFDDGRKPLQFLLDETNPLWVKAELDIYWLSKVGESPVQWLEKYAGRTPLLHIKDMTTDEEKFFAELGTGGVDLNSVLNQAENANVEWYIVEQDQTRRTPLESIEISMKYLKKRMKQEQGI
ncbi:sugar phosphate isomerase/epimerase family protein [Metabacillus malikii]|uniref:Sugar phosphate isomerase/epimerase n=1 Tax=Metabacillus malikii TaxID=1504265 RepID=A0ABT9ZAH6_9BACI|nr:sugar phosphate isomerase/epimerase [Metabacillus malikii]MDQ0229242.1 sugar phosphate isomerase/epimerase [Metabacillus malikii]